MPDRSCKKCAVHIGIRHIAGILILAGSMAFGMIALSRDIENDKKVDSYRPLRKGLTLKHLAQQKLHHGRERFVNPWNIPGSRSLFDVLMWKFSRNEFKGFYDEEPFAPVTIDWKPVKEHKGLSVTFLTHSSLLIKDSGSCILVDPVLTGLSWPYRDFTPINPDTLAAMPGIDSILITHGHYDHLDLKSISRFAQTARVVSPLGYGSLLRDAGANKLKELDWYDSVSDGSREIILLPCNHWTMRNPFSGPNTALWGSYIIKTASGQVIYISGDTASFDRFEEIGREFDIDLAIFNLGAYEPRWFMKHSHMNPFEVVTAFRELGAKKLMVIHWGTFRLGDEPVHFPRRHIRDEMKRAGLSNLLVDIEHGQTLFFDAPKRAHD